MTSSALCSTSHPCQQHANNIVLSHLKMAETFCSRCVTFTPVRFAIQSQFAKQRKKMLQTTTHTHTHTYARSLVTFAAHKQSSISDVMFVCACVSVWHIVATVVMADSVCHKRNIYTTAYIESQTK